ncbi:hypothetical protein QM012_002612 [Aureobasidium pullulans]|uniref:TPR-like protein n=1 Tax=Aureobasidium pullulans TaxID=5580 RepID=A0ABR0TBI6_AURPU
MFEQQASAGASMSDEQVIDKHSGHQDAPATDHQTSVDTAIPQITPIPTTSHDDHIGGLLSDPGKTYTLMLEHFSKGNTKEAEKLAQELVLRGPYPERVHARLFLAQVTHDAMMHVRKAVEEAASGIAKYGEKDDEKFKLLALAQRILAQLQAEEGLSDIEEVDEEDAQVKDTEQGSQEVQENENPHVKEKDDLEVKDSGTSKPSFEAMAAKWNADWTSKYGHGDPRAI